MSESEPESGHTLAVIEPAKPPRISAAVAASIVVPAIIADAGDQAARRFLEFFAATIRNKNTRMAYYRAVCRFFAWCDQHKLGAIADIEPLHVAAYIEAMQAGFEKPSVKQHLAAIRMASVRCRPATMPRLGSGGGSGAAPIGRHRLICGPSNTTDMAFPSILIRSGAAAWGRGLPMLV
jgi:hypothetical protein